MHRLRRAHLAVIVATLSAAPAIARAQTAPALPANDDVTDGTDTTDTGLLQVEFGGVVTRTNAATRATGTPLTLRYGAFDWLELSLGTDGYLAQRGPGVGRTTGLGNTLVGARLRLFAARGGLPIVSLLPQVVLPTASAARGLGSGAVDASLSALTGRDLPRHSHVDVGYGLGTVGSADAGRILQQTASIGGTLGVTASFTPGLTVAWVSRQDAETGTATTATADSVFTVSRRLAVDVSVTAGLNRQAPDVEVAAGLSVVVGELDLDDGVHARRHRLRLRPKRRPKGPRVPVVP